MKQNDKEDRFHASNGSFAFAREPRQTGASLVVNDDATAWEIYNNRALKVDKELIKDWNDSLNTLLIFVCRVSSSPTTRGLTVQGCALLCRPNGVHHREYEAPPRRQY